MCDIFYDDTVKYDALIRKNYDAPQLVLRDYRTQLQANASLCARHCDFNQQKQCFKIINEYGFK